MNLKYMKVSLFEISYKKKINFFTIYIFSSDVPVYTYTPNSGNIGTFFKFEENEN